MPMRGMAIPVTTPHISRTCLSQTTARHTAVLPTRYRLQAITNHCFATLRGMSAAQQGLLIDSIVWAFRHTERNVAETGLQLLHVLLDRFAQEPTLLAPFCQAYYLRLVQEIFAVLTDTMHKPGFRLQARTTEVVMASHLCMGEGYPVLLCVNAWKRLQNCAYIGLSDAREVALHRRALHHVFMHCVLSLLCTCTTR